MVRYFITGGGTGGHIYPAIAVADALLEDVNASSQTNENSGKLKVKSGKLDMSSEASPLPSGEGAGVSELANVTPAGEREISEIFYVGNPKNLEYDIVKQKGYKFLPVNIHGMPRKFSFSLLKWLIQLNIAVFKCCYYILKYKPDAIFGTGGYVSAPTLIAGKLLNVPFMMHDCDAQPGLVTRHLAPYASAVSVAFEPACKFLNNKNCLSLAANKPFER